MGVLSNFRGGDAGRAASVLLILENCGAVICDDIRAKRRLTSFDAGFELLQPVPNPFNDALEQLGSLKLRAKMLARMSNS